MHVGFWRVRECEREEELERAGGCARAEKRKRMFINPDIFTLWEGQSVPKHLVRPVNKRDRERPTFTNRTRPITALCGDDLNSAALVNL